MFNKLPSNSEKLLLELVQAESASQVLQAKYEGITHKEHDVLDGMVRELISFGYISAKWADNIPYIVNLSNSARTYREQLIAFEEKKTVAAQKMVVFISHRSTDKAIADMLVDFLTGTGIPKTSFFCSSLPGNDINEKISAEVKAALKDSILNIAILSRDYYQSAYCLNEAGVLWYREDVPVIPIALPEIDSKNMYGFLNNEYKLRRLDSDTDISYIYDAVSEVVSALPCKASVITYEAQKLKERYFSHLDLREEPETTSSPIDVEGITTDDERIILYYLISNGIRKVSKAVASDWLRKNEIHDVNVDNAFDLLSCIEGGAISGDTLEFGMATANHVAACDYVGLVSGNKEPDKFAKSGFHATKSEFVDAPLIDELPMALECEAVSYDPETCRLVGRIVNVSADESVLGQNGKVDVGKLRPITFDTMNNQYLVLGEKVGQAFHDGVQLK